MAELVGKTLGKYEVVARIGRGGMSEVYRGRHPRLGRDVAIKVLHAHLAEGSDFLARFEREAKAAAALHHPHIVQIYDFDAEDGAFYMVMEYVGGGTLKSRLEETAAKRAYLPLPEVARLVGEVAGALDYAHAQGVLHRDVKPSNVLLDPSGRAVLADFGIAQIVGGARYTTTGTLMGTPAYMSPEQCRGAELTPASDIYALGVILYELATGRVPFEADTPLGIAHKQIHDPLPEPRSIRPDLPAALEEVILKSLAKDPAERYQSAAEMARAVDLSLGATPQEAKARPTVVQAGPPAPPAEVPAPKTEAMKGPQAEGVAAQKTVLMAGEPGEAETKTPSKGAVDRKEAPAKRPSRPPFQGRGRLAVGAGLAIVVLLAVAIAAFSLRGRPAPCGTIEECQRLADEALGRGDPDAAAGFLQQALRLVPPSERPAFAHLWCMLGDVHRAAGRVDEAAADFRRCIEWAGENLDLRNAAEGALRELEQP